MLLVHINSETAEVHIWCDHCKMAIIYSGTEPIKCPNCDYPIRWRTTTFFKSLNYRKAYFWKGGTVV